MKTILEILAAGEYDYKYTEFPLVATSTRGLWIGNANIIIEGVETIHGNPLWLDIEWLEVAGSGKIVTEEFRFRAHGKTTDVPGDRMIEELRKHI